MNNNKEERDGIREKVTGYNPKISFKLFKQKMEGGRVRHTKRPSHLFKAIPAYQQLLQGHLQERVTSFFFFFLNAFSKSQNYLNIHPSIYRDKIFMYGLHPKAGRKTQCACTQQLVEIQNPSTKLIK